jgi:hypothetical protein
MKLWPLLLLLIVTSLSFVQGARSEQLDCQESTELPELAGLSSYLQQQACDELPALYRKDDAWGEESDPARYAADCFKAALRGMFNSGKDLIEAVWGVIKGSGLLLTKFSYLHVPYAKAVIDRQLPFFYAEMLSDDSGFIEDLWDTLKSIPQGIAQLASRHYQQWHCLNRLGKTEYVCRSLAYVGSDVVIGVLSGTAATKLLTKQKHVRSIPELVYVPRNMSAARPLVTMGRPSQQTIAALRQKYKSEARFRTQLTNIESQRNELSVLKNKIAQNPGSRRSALLQENLQQRQRVLNQSIDELGGESGFKYFKDQQGKLFD